MYANGIKLDELWHDQSAVAYRPDHPLSDVLLTANAELAQHDFITAHGPGCHQGLALFTAAGVSPKVVARDFHRQTILTLVQSGAGVTLIPGSYLGIAMIGLTFKPVQSDDAG
ncbi:MAG: hypothetical protein H0W74_00710 [Sphingosinicella sp.]|nr:hypothetical protein [Sphingosinicella sp.]